MRSSGGRSDGLIGGVLASIPEENRSEDFSVSDHGCRAGVIYDKRVVNGVEYDVTTPCAVCLVESVRAKLPERCRGGWEAWQPVPQLAKLVPLVRKWKGEPWCLLLHGQDGVV